MTAFMAITAMLTGWVPTLGRDQKISEFSVLSVDKK